MAILHRAWTFDAPAAAEEVAALIETGGLDHLRAAAHAIVLDAVPATAGALSELRFDPTWIDAPDDRSDRAVESVVILFASRLVPAPSLRTLSGGHLVLERTLAALGWSAHDVALLLRGLPLETIFATYGEPAVRESVAGIGQYGGWLSRYEAPAMLARLDEAAKLLSPSEGDDARTVLGEARAMVDASRRRNADLFLLLD